MKRTDDDIVKALESYQFPKLAIISNQDCKITVSDILGVIKRYKSNIEKLEKIEHFATKTIEKQSAEMERLQKESISDCELAMSIHDDTNVEANCDYCISQAKVESQKEFAEKLRTELICNVQRYHCSVSRNQSNLGYLVDDVLYTIDKLLQ